MQKKFTKFLVILIVGMAVLPFHECKCLPKGRGCYRWGQQSRFSGGKKGVSSDFEQDPGQRQTKHRYEKSRIKEKNIQEGPGSTKRLFKKFIGALAPEIVSLFGTGVLFSLFQKMSAYTYYKCTSSGRPGRNLDGSWKGDCEIDTFVFCSNLTACEFKYLMRGYEKAIDKYCISLKGLPNRGLCDLYKKCGYGPNNTDYKKLEKVVWVGKEEDSGDKLSCNVLNGSLGRNKCSAKYPNYLDGCLGNSGDAKYVTPDPSGCPDTDQIIERIVRIIMASSSIVLCSTVLCLATILYCTYVKCVKKKKKTKKIKKRTKLSDLEIKEIKRNQRSAEREERRKKKKKIMKDLLAMYTEDFLDSSSSSSSEEELRETKKKKKRKSKGKNRCKKIWWHSVKKGSFAKDFGLVRLSEEDTLTEESGRSDTTTTEEEYFSSVETIVGSLSRSDVPEGDSSGDLESDDRSVSSESYSSSGFSSDVSTQTEEFAESC